MNEKIQVIYNITWNDHISCVIEMLEQEPVFCRMLKPLDEKIVVDFYENQWKSKTPGHRNYTQNPISIHNHRPKYSTLSGEHVLPKSQIMPPNPLWDWIDEWHLDCSLNSESGWVYVDDWKLPIQKAEGSTKFRFRRWIRTCMLKKVTFLKNKNRNYF